MDQMHKVAVTEKRLSCSKVLPRMNTLYTAKTRGRIRLETGYTQGKAVTSLSYVGSRHDSDASCATAELRIWRTICITPNHRIVE